MKRILVIDDSEVNLFLINSIFENEPDIQIHILSKSDKALSVLREGNFDLIILDLMMPHIDGFQLLAEIKSDVELKGIPVIVVSARQDKEAEQEVRKYGIEEYIRKPINLKSIENKIRSVIQV